MQKPRTFLIRMTLFVGVVVLLAVALRQALMGAFLANVVLNGVILGVLVIGIAYAYRRVVDLNTELDWIAAFKRIDGAGTSVTPRLMAPAAALLAASQEGGMRLTAQSMRSVLDGIASRLEESREISKYLTGLLVFLGLLGTFWGLLGTIGAIGGTIKGLTVDGSDMALMFDELKAGLEAPLGGMGTAFSSSLFGLAGSLVLGFMDLQASQAQTRFYNEVEDWLAGATKLSRADEEEGPNAYMAALMEQTADGIDRLNRTLQRSQEGSGEMEAGLRAIAESVAALADRLQGQDEALARAEETNRKLLLAMERMTRIEDRPPPAPVPALDAASKEHIRNLDVGLKRLTEAQARQSERMLEDLRDDIKLLARTLAAGMDSARLTARRPGPKDQPKPGPHQPVVDATAEAAAHPGLSAVGGTPATGDRTASKPKKGESA